MRDLLDETGHQLTRSMVILLVLLDRARLTDDHRWRQRRLDRPLQAGDSVRLRGSYELL